MMYNDDLFFQSIVTAIGGVTVYANANGILRVALCSFNEVMRKNTMTEKACREIEEYFAGSRKEFDLPLLLNGSPFNIKVWNALRDIPYGVTVSYKDVAKMTGSPKATRAVGNANHKNPIPLIIPCHRVISADGKIGGYGYPIEIKQKLLALEHYYR